ncbi:MAG: glycosyltransferase family 4 protein [Gemmatimonadaceae bacterium]
MRILVLSFYYRPDLSAGSFRVAALADALVKLLPRGGQVDVITTLPNRYKSFTAEAPETEQSESLSIHRVALPRHESGMLDQSLSFLAFASRAMQIARGQKYDAVFASSSRLMTAVLAARIAKRVQAKLYLDIRDIFVDTMRDVAPALSWLVPPIASLLERSAIASAAKVNLVSPGFAEYFRARYPHRKFSFITNGVDEEFVGETRIAGELVPGAAGSHARNSASKAFANGSGRRSVLYAGNLGDGQGLHEIVPRLAKRMEREIQFTIIGDGGRKPQLVAALARAEASNVEVLPPIRRKELIEAYRAADVLFLHLNDYPAFRKVLPSKLFEYGAMGKPVWAGVSGYAAEFVSSELENAAVFAPCDVDGAVRSFRNLQFKTTKRADFVSKFARGHLIQQLAEDVLSIVPR